MVNERKAYMMSYSSDSHQVIVTDTCFIVA